MRHDTAKMLSDNINKRAPFVHSSYRGVLALDGAYELWHWNTMIFKLTASGEMAYGDLSYYSQTTSVFQGIIIRALSDKNWAVVKELFKDDKEQLKRLSKMRDE